MTETLTKAKILPFYLIVDVSYSMENEGKLDSANTIVDELQNALVDQPVIGVDGRETRAQFTITADEDAALGEKVLRLTGRSASGRQVLLDLRVKVEP